VTGAYRRVVVTSGHMIDTPERVPPRFPAAIEPAVASEIETLFDRWDVGPGDLVINGCARGADILFAESAQRRGAAIEFILALPPEAFEKTSVFLPRTIWTQRYRYLLANHPFSVASSGPVEGEDRAFALANDKLFERAHQLCPPAEMFVALIWDKKPTGGQGGTGEVADRAARDGRAVAIIDPTALNPN
jgi:hypothetical protein